MGNMKNYEIDACAYGTYWKHDVNCPSDWRGSGCYDVEVEGIQKAHFTIAAENLGDALKMLDEHFCKNQGEWEYNVLHTYYLPSFVEESESEEDEPDILDVIYEKPEEAYREPKGFEKIVY